MSRYLLWASACLLGVVLGFLTERPGVAQSKLSKAGAGKKEAVSRKVEQSDITELEQRAARCRSADEAVNLYTAFIAVSQMTPTQQALVASRHKVWQERVEKRMMRLGAEWVTPEKAREVGKAADRLIEQAFEKIKSADFKSARNLLEKATQADPSGVRADFYLGMLNSPNFWNYATAAEKHFNRASRRDPENSGLLNNLALTEVKMGRFSEAIDHWADALRVDVPVPEVTQNLGRFIKESEEKKVAPTKSHIDRARKIYEKAVADKKGKPSSDTVGWVYSQIVLPSDEQKRSGLNEPETPSDAAEKTEPTVKTVLVSSGSGFVIQPGIVLTNRHVVEGQKRMGVVLSTNKEQEYPAKLLAVSKDDDLDVALIQCESLPATPVNLGAEPPRRGAQVMALGFPLTTVLGDSLKTTSGLVFGFNDDEKRRIVMHTAEINPGNSGGPLSDITGTVIAVNFALQRYSNRSSGADVRIFLAHPIEAVLPFLKEHLKDLTLQPQAEKLDTAEVDAKVSPSTVMIKIYGAPIPLAIANETKKAADPYEDTTCSACKGRAVVVCPVKGCNRGSVSEFEDSFSIEGTGTGAQVVRWKKPRSASCPGCQGAGVVKCPHCSTGLDPKLGR